MAITRTPITTSVSSLTQKIVNSLKDFEKVEISRPRKFPLSGKILFISVVTLILSALAGAIVPWIVDNLLMAGYL